MTDKSDEVAAMNHLKVRNLGYVSGKEFYVHEDDIPVNQQITRKEIDAFLAGIEHQKKKAQGLVEALESGVKLSDADIKLISNALGLAHRFIQQGSSWIRVGIENMTSIWHEDDVKDYIRKAEDALKKART